MTIKDYGLFLTSNSNLDSKTECWIWKKTKTKFGYGMATRKDTGNTGLAHRESYRHFIGEIPDKMLVLHKCDNPACINPNHLFLGTQKDNMEDMKKKNRSPVRSGINGTTVKLTIDQVNFIKQFVPEKRGDLVKLAKSFNIAKTTVCDIRKGRTWK